METWTTLKEVIHKLRLGSGCVRHSLYTPFQFSALAVFGNVKNALDTEDCWELYSGIWSFRPSKYYLTQKDGELNDSFSKFVVSRYLDKRRKAM